MAKNLKSTGTEQKKAAIEVLDHPKFDGGMKTNITSSIEVAELVSSLFAPAFSDYYGCKISINNGTIPATTIPIGAIYVDLYFKDQGEASDNSWKNIEPTNKATPAGTDIASRFMKVNGAMNNSRAYQVTKETYEALDEFSFVNRTRWNEHTTEITSPMSIYGKEEIVVRISGLSLNKIITKIYGDKTEEGRYEYIATPSTIIPSKTSEFIMQISQLDLSVVRNLQQTLGIYTPSSPEFNVYKR